jgi:hypothetical protein
MRRLLFLLLLCLAAPLVAQDQCEKLTHETLQAYGCLDALKNYPSQLQAQLSAQIGHDQSMNAAEKARFTDAIMKNISAERLAKNVETSMSTGCNPLDLTTVLADVKTPLVQKMRGFEAVLNTKEGAEQLRTYLASPAAQSATEKRKKLIGDLIAASDSTDALVETIIATSRGMMEGMGAPSPTAEQVAQMKQRVQGQADSQMQSTMLAVYRDATDDELEKYVSLQQSAPMKSFNQAFGKAVAKGMGMEAHAMGVVLKQLLEQLAAERKKTEAPTPAPGTSPPPPK